jgi:SAM-dependent methyltransferase
MYTITHKFNDAKLSELVPTDSMYINAPGDGDFLTMGKHFASILIDKCGLKSDSHILDIGCSVGRNAIPLTEIVTTGEYRGFDVVKNSIDYATRTITPKYPNFIFEHVNIYNGVYNMDRILALNSEMYHFDYSSDKFDIVFLVSVFTHMITKDVEAYMKEIVRVLKPGGKLFITYFILDDDSKAAMDHSQTDRKFPFEHGNYSAADEAYHEGALAYKREYIHDLYKRNGLKIDEINNGFWRMWANRDENAIPSECITYQDAVFATK